MSSTLSKIALALALVTCSAGNHEHSSSEREERRLQSPDSLGNKIYGGTNAPKEYPWMARFEAVGCGGSLVAKNVVMTAAHCVDSRGMPEVLIGPWDLSNWKNEDYGWTPEKRKAEGVALHPDMDIALVFLDKDSKLEPLNMAKKEPKVGEEMLVTGWEGYDDILQQAELLILKDKVCSDNDIVKSYELCAGRPDASQHTCAGDSGAPLFLEKKGKLQVVGVLNRGPSCPGTHDVYASVPAHLDWIEKTIKDGPPPPKEDDWGWDDRDDWNDDDRDDYSTYDDYDYLDDADDPAFDNPVVGIDDVLCPQFEVGTNQYCDCSYDCTAGNGFCDCAEGRECCGLPACEDSSEWHKGGTNPSKSKDCEWVSKKPDPRCAVKGQNGILASEACPVACSTCDVSYEPSPQPSYQPSPMPDRPVPDVETIGLLTSGYYNIDSDYTKACKDEFGKEYRTADWNDVTALDETYVNSMIVALGVPLDTSGQMSGREEGVLLMTRDGEQYEVGWEPRKWFAGRHDGSPPSNWWVADQHGGLTLGSWYDFKGRVLCWPLEESEESCVDSEDWFYKKEQKNCMWVAEDPQERCNGKYKSDDKVKSKKACPKACGRC